MPLSTPSVRLAGPTGLSQSAKRSHEMDLFIGSWQKLRNSLFEECAGTDPSLLFKPADFIIQWFKQTLITSVALHASQNHELLSLSRCNQDPAGQKPFILQSPLYNRCALHAWRARATKLSLCCVKLARPPAVAHVITAPQTDIWCCDANQG